MRRYLRSFFMLLTLCLTTQVRAADYYWKFQNGAYAGGAPLSSSSLTFRIDTSNGRLVYWSKTDQGGAKCNLVIPSEIPVFSDAACTTPVLDSEGEQLKVEVKILGRYTTTTQYQWSQTKLEGITIPPTVQRIETYTFQNMTTLTTINFSDPANSRCTNIDSYAFDACSQLSVLLNFPTSLTTISNYAFRNCYSITTADFLPSSITTLGTYTFQNCRGIKEFGVKRKYNSLTSMGAGVFSGCSGLTTVVVPASVTTIGNYAFQNCSALSSLSIEETSNLASIGQYAFQYCRALQALPDFPSSLKNLGNSCFYYCTNIHSLEGLSATQITTIPNSAFSACDITSLEGMPSTVTSIGNYAFQYNRNLTNLEGMSPNVQTIGTSAFYACDALTSLDGISPNLVTIGDKAFYELKNLTDISALPSTLKTIGKESFMFCSALTSLEGLSGTSVETIGSYAFYDTGLTSLRGLPSTLKTIKDYAFYGCHSLVSGDADMTSVETIGNYVFAYSENLPSLPEFGPSLTSMGSNVCEGCSKLKDITGLKNSRITTIKSNSFYRCYELTDIDMPSTLTTIETCAFQECTSLATMQGFRNTNLTSIGSYAFQKNTSLATLEGLPSTLTNIDEYAFNACAIASLQHLPAGVTELKESVFEANKIKEIDLSTTPIKKFGTRSLADNRIGYLDMPNTTNVDEISAGAFSSQNNELTVEFHSETVPTYIKGYPFYLQRRAYKPNPDEPRSETNDYKRNCLRVIVPINCINAYAEDPIMSGCDISDYRVKYDWNFNFPTEAVKNGEGYIEKLYNITPQQRLIATSSWHNDVLNFRPEIIEMGDSLYLYRVQRGGFAYYTNSVDSWDETTHKATPIVTEHDFFDQPNGSGGGFLFNRGGFNNAATFEEQRKKEDSYPQSLMPYTIHSYHYNSGNGTEKLGRRPVVDGIVPPDQGVIIDFPKPGCYLVPPAAMSMNATAMMRPIYRVYLIQEDYYTYKIDLEYLGKVDINSYEWNNSIRNVVGYSGGAAEFTSYANFKDFDADGNVMMYNFNGTTLKDNLHAGASKQTGYTPLSSLVYSPYQPILMSGAFTHAFWEDSKVWVDLWADDEDYETISSNFRDNHDNHFAEDHNVMIACPDRFPLWPYWTASPYIWDDNVAENDFGGSLMERFGSSDPTDPTTFDTQTYGHMGTPGNKTGDFVKLGGELDSEIRYVNFMLSNGYFVQVKSQPAYDGTQSKWTQANRAYFSVNKNHMPSYFGGDPLTLANDMKWAVELEEETETTPTGIKEIEQTESPSVSKPAVVEGWFTIDGRPLSGRPNQKGMYIHNGRKEVVR